MRSHCLGKPKKKKELGAGHVGEKENKRGEKQTKKSETRIDKGSRTDHDSNSYKKNIACFKDLLLQATGGFSDKEGMERYEVQLKSAVVADADKGSREKGTGNVAGTC